LTRKQLADQREKEKQFQLSLVGKIVKSYGGGKDKILEVNQNNNYGYIYTVKDIKTNEIRKHGTLITLKDIIS
jgi:hypothetical protein